MPRRTSTAIAKGTGFLIRSPAGNPNTPATAIEAAAQGSQLEGLIVTVIVDAAGSDEMSTTPALVPDVTFPPLAVTE